VVESEKIIGRSGLGFNQNNHKIGKRKVRPVQERGLKNQSPIADNHERK
jgi:hypothetical protein